MPGKKERERGEERVFGRRDRKGGGGKGWCAALSLLVSDTESHPCSHYRGHTNTQPPPREEGCSPINTHTVHCNAVLSFNPTNEVRCGVLETLVFLCRGGNCVEISD